MNPQDKYPGNIISNKTDIIVSDEFVSFGKNGNFLIVDEDGIIHHKSSNFFAGYNFKEEIKSITEINSDPDISLIIRGMKFNKTDRLSIELLIDFMVDNKVKDYLVQLHRINLLGKKLFLLLFEENKVYKIFENKINTLQFALEKGNIPVLIADEEYRTKYITQKFEEIFEKNIEVLYDTKITDVLEKFVSGNDAELIRYALETKQNWSKVISLKDKADKKIFYDFGLTSVFDPAFNQWNYILYAYDITDHILKNRALKKDEKRLRAVINNISEGIFVIKKSGDTQVLHICNEQLFKMFGVDLESFMKVYFENEQREELWQTVHQSVCEIEQNKLGGKNYKFYDKESDKFYEVNITFIDDEYESERLYIVALRDISVQVKYEKHLETAYAKEKELNKLKTLILHNMSHELRTPANAMMGYTEILEDSVNTDDYESIVEISRSIKEILGKLINLFNNIVEVSGLTSGNVQVEKVKINCNQILNSVFNKKQPYASAKQLEFSLNIFKHDILIETDWKKFEKIIYELTDNAIKFTNEGRVSIESYLNGDKTASIKIADTGSGIEQSKITRMFEPFEQEDEFYTRSYEGSGLGLTIAYKLTNILGGSLNIDSKKPGGTTVTLKFPTVESLE